MFPQPSPSAASLTIDLLRERRSDRRFPQANHDLVEKSPQFAEPANGETRDCYDLCRTGFRRGHPTGKKMRCSVRTANQQMYSSIVLVFTQNDEALLCQRMKWVGDSDFACQNSGIMNCLPMQVVSAQLRSIRCWEQPSSTGSIRSSTSAAFSNRSPITRSTASRSCCPGISPHLRTISPDLKCPLGRLDGHLSSQPTPHGPIRTLTQESMALVGRETIR